MRLLWILLSIFVQGSLARLFKAQPQALSVVHQGDAVLLECVTNEPVTCGWKLETLGLGATGFLNNMVPGNLDISARDKNSDMDCTITLNNVDNRFNGVYTCSPYTKNGGQANSDAAEVVIAQKPSRLEFLGAAAGSFELTASADQPTSVTCEASGARPKAKLEWYLENTQIYEGVVVTDTKDPATGLVTTNSTLTHRFRKENNGDQLRCVASHAGYDDQDSREQAIVVDVQYAPYRPEGNNVGKIYGFTAGEEGQVTLSFTANPMPGPMSWKIGDNVFVQTGSQSLDGRFTAGSLVTIDGQRGKYNLTLTIAPVRMEDQSKTFQLRLENEMGPTALEFTIGTGPAPPPQVMSSSAIVGAVVGGLVLLLIIGLVAFGRSRGKWCFAADSAECRSDRLLKSSKTWYGRRDGGE
ncbi:cell adhesion molecule 3-like isoform X2 [Pollicipes pollicipes]|uniref:cell adhesion molecule 3-like isoform X2 n=1 Tax=Pollicipes pollicipes TaxID=41117 RepID=UPI001885958D|nr:cell adhesion molecule 3-like isoform X2 [Pollicipes pollicipes]